MAATTARRRLTDEERAARVAALAAELAAAVQNSPTRPAGGRGSRRRPGSRRYSLNNQLLLWAQGTERGMTLSRVAAFGTWRKLGYRVRAGEKGLRIFGPVTRRLRADEVPSWLAQGRDPFDPDGRPRLVVRGFTVEYAFDLSQVDPGPDAQPLPDTRPWIAQRGDGPAGLWPALAALTEAHGFTLTVRPAGPMPMVGRTAGPTTRPERCGSTATATRQNGCKSWPTRPPGTSAATTNTGATFRQLAAGDRGRQRRLRRTRRPGPQFRAGRGDPLRMLRRPPGAARPREGAASPSSLSFATASRTARLFTDAARVGRRASRLCSTSSR